MKGIRSSRLNELHPSQLYISTAKLAEVLLSFDPAGIEPVPVKRLGDDLVMTDGHTRAFAAHLCGATEIATTPDEDGLDWEAYEVCVRWCKKEGIRWIGDLVGRVVGPDEYEVVWRGRCAAMHRELAAKRAREKSDG